MNPIPSNKRAVNKKSTAVKSTLDIQHNNHINKLQGMQSERDTLQQQVVEFDDRIRGIEQVLPDTDNGPERDALIDELVGLKDKRIAVLDKINKIQEKFDPDKYFTETASVLFQYYDIVEKGTNGGGSAIPKPATTSAHESHSVKASSATANNNSILRFFTPAASASVNTNTSTNTNNTNESAAPKTGASENHVSKPKHVPEKDSESTRGSLLDQYMRLVREDYISDSVMNAAHIHEKCNVCGSKCVVTLVNDGYLHCTHCHAVEYVVIDHDKPSYRDPPKEVSFYAYKRTNHLNEWLSQIQGKETTEIPEEVYDKILLEIKKQKITNMAQITPKKIRDILRKLQINKYEHIPHIISRLTGRPMMQMPPELEDKLRTMFKQVQTPFLRHSPPSRKNFLSYSYVLHKMLQLLGKDEYLHMFGLLKSRDKLAAQDQIWRKICDELGWEFIPSA